MKLRDLNKLMENPILVNEKLKGYEKKQLLWKQLKDEAEIKGHVKKAERNLKFVYDNMKIGYFDWCITGCYYTVYHAALALLIMKGYTSKNHDATLCVLIKEYYKHGVNFSDIKLINKFFLDYQDLLFYVQSKDKREDATYSSKYKFDKRTVEILRLQAIVFVNKVKEILKE